MILFGIFLVLLAILIVFVIRFAVAQSKRLREDQVERDNAPSTTAQGPAGASPTPSDTEERPQPGE